MPLQRLPVGRLAALAAVVVAALILLRGASAPHWRTLRPGLEFATLRGGPYCRRGSNAIALLRLDPARVRIRVHHYAREPARRPPNIVEWQRMTGALAVFNAGQYFPDFSYMGVLVCAGDVVSSRVHPSFKAALVAAPLDGTGAAHVLDLELEPLDLDSLRWREVAQSFMLFDRSGRIRVRQSDHVANRTAVGEDRHGRLVVITTEGGYTIGDFARLIQKSPLQLSHAMSMDGGYEAELCVNAAGFRYASFGDWKQRPGKNEAPGAQVPLPAVISVSAP
jgi:hypothetical protein